MNKYIKSTNISGDISNPYTFFQKSLSSWVSSKSEKGIKNISHFDGNIRPF